MSNAKRKVGEHLLCLLVYNGTLFQLRQKRAQTVKTFRKTLLTEALNEQKYLSHFNP